MWREERRREGEERRNLTYPKGRGDRKDNNLIRLSNIREADEVGNNIRKEGEKKWIRVREQYRGRKAGNRIRSEAERRREGRR